ncbi:hypothetical protein SprV_0802490000 [Sparganum proliferum]
MPWSRNNRVTTLQLYNLRTRDLLVELPLCLDSQSQQPEAPLGPSLPLLEAWIEETNAERLRSPLSPWRWQPHQGASACGGCNSNSLPSTPAATGSATASRRAVGVRALGCFNRPASVLFDFDPRFLNSRIVIANVNFLKPSAATCPQLAPADMFGVPAPVLSLVRLPTWEQLAKTRNFGGLELVPPTDRGSSAPAAGHRRRRASMDATQTTAAPSGVNILKVFYSRAGHLIFALVTNTFNCRCSSVNSVFPFYAAAASPSTATTPSSSSSPSTPPVGACVGGSSPSGTLSSAAQQAVRDSPLPRLRCTRPTAADNASEILDGASSAALDSFSSRTRLGTHHHSHQHQHQQSPGAGATTTTTITAATGCYPPPPGCTSLFLLVFNSDSLDILRLLRFDRPICPLHTCPTNYVPTMSRCGSRLAVVTMVTATAAAAAVGASGGTHARPQAASRSGNSQARSARAGRKMTFSSHASLTAATASEFVGVEFATPRRRATDGRANQFVQSWTGQGCHRDHDWNEEQTTTTIQNTLTDEESHQSQLHRRQQHHHHGQSASTRRITVASCVTGDATIIANTHLPHSGPSFTTVDFGSGGGGGGVGGQLWRRTDAVFVYQLEPPPTLQAIVRQKIRQYFPDAALDHLGLPPGIVTFLRFKPSFACSGSCLSRSESSTLTMRSTSLDLL